MAQFPYQKLTRAEKVEKFGSIEEWGKSVISTIDQASPVNYYGYAEDNYEKRVLSDLVEDIIDEHDYRHIMQPYGELIPKFPGAIRNYNRIKSRLRALVGEELIRPFNFRFTAVNREAVNQYQKKKKELLVESYNAMMAEELKKLNALPAETEIPPYQLPSQINKYMKTNFQSDFEIYANQTTAWIERYLDPKDKFIRGFEDLLYTGDEVYYISNTGKDPVFRKVHPLYFSFDRTPSMTYIDEAAWTREVLFMSAPMIYEQFGDILSDEDKDLIENAQGTWEGSTNMAPYANLMSNLSIRNDDRLSSTTSVPVYYYTWISRRKYGVVTYKNEEGEILERDVDESYEKKSEDIRIEWDWMNEVWEAFRFGNNVVRGVRPRANQYRGMDNINKVRVPYTGVSDMTLSLVRQIKHLQYYFNSVMFLMEQALRKAKGMVLNVDTSQIPTGEGRSFDKWLAALQIDGINFFNSMEENKLYPGRFPQFNQISSTDLTISNTIQQYIGILDKIDMLIEDISGITRQRVGAVQTSETVGGVERAVQGSSSVTELIFYIHNNVKLRAMSMLLEECKVCWWKGKKTQLILDDMTRMVMDIDGYEFNSAEYGIFGTNSKKDMEISSFIKTFAQAAVQNGQKVRDVIAVMNTESIAEKLAILDAADEEAQKKAAEAAQAQMQAEQQARAEDYAHEEKMLDKKIAADLEKAQVQALGFAEDKDANDNLVPDVFEQEKFQQQAEKQVKENDNKQRQLDQKDRELDIKQKQVEDTKELSEKEMEIKRRQGTGI